MCCISLHLQIKLHVRKLCISHTQWFLGIITNHSYTYFWIWIIKQITVWIFCEITICLGSVLCSLNPPSPLCSRSKPVHIPALHVEDWETAVKDINWAHWNEPGAATVSALPKENCLAQCWTRTFSFRHRCYPQADTLCLADRSHLCFTAVLMLTDEPFHIAFSSFLCALMV